MNHLLKNMKDLLNTLIIIFVSAGTAILISLGKGLY